MERSAVVYAVNDRLIVAPNRRTATGLRVQVNPTAIDGSAGPTELSGSISAALDASALTAIPPRDWKGVFVPFLQAAGVRNMKVFMASARMVDVDERDGTFEVTPNRNLGPKEGFEPIPSETIRLSDWDAIAPTVLEKLRTA